MTREDIDRMRAYGAIQTEVSIIRAIPSFHWGGAQLPNILGGNIQKECLDRIEALLDGLVKP